MLSAMPCALAIALLAGHTEADQFGTPCGGGKVEPTKTAWCVD